MKRRLQLSIHFTWLLAMLAVCLESCDNDDTPATIPEVTTTTPTGITSEAALSGGEILTDGNSRVIASGLCWSSGNNTPTIADDTTKLTILTGQFTSHIKDLVSSTKYYVRAYAINNIGVGYGNVVTFTTGNAPPTVSDILIEGVIQVSEKLTASYQYVDAEDDAQGATALQWYIAEDAAGSGETAIDGATNLDYTLKEEDEFKFIRFGVKPIAVAGTTIGMEVKSPFVGPVAEEPTTVTFTYNGASVTYGVIISPITGRRWLDRNLGATNVPASYNDYINEGDLFQWGRGTDGHQLVTRNSDGSSTPVNDSFTISLSNSDTPGHNKFIIGADPSYDWRSTPNNNLWQGSSGTNNPCPLGWHIPTKAEWEAEKLSTNSANNYNQLKITYTGYREAESGQIYSSKNACYYWSSSVSSNVAWSWDIAYGLDLSADQVKTLGAACKCIKDGSDD